MKITDKDGNDVPLSFSTFHIWLMFLPLMIKLIVGIRFNQWFYNNTLWGVAFIHKTWETYKESPLFAARYHSYGIEKAVSLFTIEEFEYYLKKTWNNKTFLKELLFHPYKTVCDLIDSDVYWKEKSFARILK